MSAETKHIVKFWTESSQQTLQQMSLLSALNKCVFLMNIIENSLIEGQKVKTVRSITNIYPYTRLAMTRRPQVRAVASEWWDQQ